MIKVSKLAELFQLLFFCFAIISILIPQFLNAISGMLKLEQNINIILGDFLKTTLIIFFICFPSFIALYKKLKNDHPLLIWKILPIFINVILAFGVLVFNKSYLFFSLLSLLFLGLSTFFGSLMVFHIVWRRRNV